MNTKGAIEFLELTRENFDVIPTWKKSSKIYEGISKVIELLQRGEKSKQIVEDIKQYIIDRQTIEEDFATNGKEIIDLIDWLKRKYLPEPKEIKIDWEDKFYELEEEFKENEKELKREIEYWKFRYYNKVEKGSVIK